MQEWHHQLPIMVHAKFLGHSLQRLMSIPQCTLSLGSGAIFPLWFCLSNFQTIMQHASPQFHMHTFSIVMVYDIQYTAPINLSRISFVAGVLMLVYTWVAYLKEKVIFLAQCYKQLLRITTPALNSYMNLNSHVRLLIYKQFKKLIQAIPSRPCKKYQEK